MSSLIPLRRRTCHHKLLKVSAFHSCQPSGYPEHLNQNNLQVSKASSKTHNATATRHPQTRNPIPGVPSQQPTPHNAAFTNPTATRIMRRPSLLSRAHWTATLPVNTTTEFQLLLTTFATGIQDVVLLQDFICFASGQTGNIVKLGAGFARRRHPDYSCLILPGISLGAFIAAVFLTGRASAYFGARRRGLQVALALGQTLVLGATALVLHYAQGSSHSSSSSQGHTHSHAHPHVSHNAQLDPTSPSSRLSLALLAFATASQIAAARAWDLSEITTAMATGALVDLFNDPKFFARKNRRRDLRVLFFLVLIAGCAVAAGLKRWGRLGAPGLLGVSVGVKGLAVGVLGWMGEDENGEGDGDGNGDIDGEGDEEEARRMGTGRVGGDKPG